MTHPNAERYRQLYRALSSGDFATARGLLAPDCVWHLPSRVIGGDFVGPEEMLMQFLRYAVETHGTYQAEIHAVLADDEHVVAMGVGRASRNGKFLEDHWVQVLHLRDGRFSEVWHHPGDQHAIDEFFS